MVRAVLPSEFLCQAEAICSTWQTLSVPQILHTGVSKDTQRGRPDLMQKSCHWDGSPEQRRISTLPLNHADKCWAQQVSCSRLVALWCKVQKCWRPLNGTMRLIRLVWSHTFIHPPWKTLWKLCHLIQVLRIHYYPLVHIFSTDIWGEKKDVKYLKNVYDMSLLKRKRWCVKEPLPHFG